MAKPITGKCVTFEVEMYWRGKTKKPSVNITYAGDNYEGLPDTVDDTAFGNAARDLCRQLIEAGELD